MDKEFYEGVVKSYDHEKKKHVVLYNDGDVEVLRLDKERWELVDRSSKAVKRLKFSKSTPSKGVSSKGKKKASGDSKENKKPVEISPPSKVKAKRTPRKNMRRGASGASKGKPKTESGEAEDRWEEADLMSQPESAKMFDNDFDIEKKSKRSEESDKDDKSVSGEKPVEPDAESSSSDTKQESKEMEGEADSGEKTIEDDDAPQGGSDDEDKQEQPDDASSEEELREAATDDDEGEKSDLQGNLDDHHQTQGSDEEMTHSETKEADDGSRENSGDAAADDLEKESSPTDDDNETNHQTEAELEISDDEPLGMWQRRLGKSVQRK